jgi:hypothetical protein
MWANFILFGGGGVINVILRIVQNQKMHFLCGQYKELLNALYGQYKKVNK